MKGKQLFVLLILAVVAGGGWYFLAERNRASWSEKGTGGGKVIEFPLNDVARIKIKNSASELNLVKKADAWLVQERGDYPASFEQVSGLLRKFWDLKTVQEVKAGPSQLPRLGLDEPGKGDKSGTLVEFIGADGKTIAAVILGKKLERKIEGAPDAGAFPTGRYLKPVGSTKVSLVSDVLDDVDPAPEHWLAKDFIKVDSAKSIAVSGPTDAQKWTVTRDDPSADWKLSDAKPDEKVDSGKTFALGNILSAPTIDDVLGADAKPADTGLDKPTTATIETFDGFSYVLKIGKPNGKSTPVTVSVSANLAKERTPGKDEKPEAKAKLDEAFKAKQKTLEEKLANEQKIAGRVFLVSQFALEPLLKDRSALLADKPAPAPAPAPAAGLPPAPGPGPVPVPAPATPVTPPAPAAPPAPAPVPKPAAPPVPAPAPAPKPADEAPAKPAPEAAPKPAAAEPPAKP